MPPIADRSRVLAVLGPTNTGKTHYAIDRMLSYPSGTIGFPLRLLARENYDRVARLKGRGRVALVTGEEKIVPPDAAYFICTVESMPRGLSADFVAIDEIQLAADPERGHVFTDRLLHARGLEETVFLGAETIRPLLRRLVPEAEFLGRPRFSQLTHIGARKLARLPRRSAVVAFSAGDVYALAELLRRQRGGTAVVLGALSPRTRNAQVEMYQSGEVDYLVATDAIGMGLNMDIDHVAFARLEKFDGRAVRRLRPAELAQIAGRAGRHMADGTFGTTGDAGAIEAEVVEAIESHVFDPLPVLMWRNDDLDFRSAPGLLRSLERRPDRAGLRRAPEADDQITLGHLLRDGPTMDRAGAEERVRLLWEVCQIPDFRKILSDDHTRLVAAVFRQLTGATGRLATDWVGRQIAALARTDGDIDTLIGRLAHIRTWTYIAHRQDWLADARAWQERARGVEDLLSDALHERLTQRFVDRRSAALSRQADSGEAILAAVTRRGEVVVEGQYIGRLDGFRFVPDATAHSAEARALSAAAGRALSDEIRARVRRLETAGDEAITLSPEGIVHWDGAPVARLAAGRTVLRPAVRPLASDLLEPRWRDRIARRLAEGIARTVDRALAPLVRLSAAPPGGSARGLAFQLAERLGTVSRAQVADLVRGLGPAERRQLARLGIVIGEAHVFMPRLLRGRAVAMRGLLYAVAQSLTLPPPLPAAGAASVRADASLPEDFWLAVGYVRLGDRAVRVDRLQALATACRPLAKQGAFAVTPRLAGTAGVPVALMPRLLNALGYRGTAGPDGIEAFQRPASRKRPRPRSAARSAAPAEGPFGKLRELAGG